MDRSSKLIHKYVYGVYRKLKWIVVLPLQILKIHKYSNKASYYTNLKRKNIVERWWDNFIWFIRNGEFNKYYTSWGLDVKNFRNPNDFLSEKKLFELQRKGGQTNIESGTGHYNYIVILRDKYLFAAYLKSTIGSENIVEVDALVSNSQVFITADKEWKTIDSLFEKNERLVFKVTYGSMGNDIFVTEKKEDKLYLQSKVVDLEEIKKIIGNRQFIVQKIIKQHEKLALFKTKSVNTLRVITIRGKSGDINMFSAFLRLGNSSDSFVDNRAQGGLAVGIDLDSGRLLKYGYPHDQFGGPVDAHELSGTKFENYQIPYWRETIDLVFRVHKQFYTIQAIGWDVVITNDGPVLLEGNDDFEIGGAQDTMGGLKSRWFNLLNS